MKIPQNLCYNSLEVITMIKDDVKQLIDKLPDDCSIEDIQYTLYVHSKIQKGQKDMKEGHLISQDEVEKRMEKWFGK